MMRITSNTPPYVSRDTWGARDPLSTTPMPGSHLRSYIHHTAGNESGAAGMRSIQNQHMNTRKFQDIAYSWVFDSDGTIYEGRGWGVTHGANFGTDNSTSYSFCLMGNFEHESPSSAATDSLVSMIRYGIHASFLSGELKGHRDEPDASTACPGKNLYAQLPRLRTLVTTPEPSPSIPVPLPTPKEILMDQAINFFVRNMSNGAILFVMRNLQNSDYPCASMGVTGPWKAPDGAIVWNVQPDDFSFFSRYRIDNRPLPERDS